MADWTIRRALIGDADALAACIDAAYAHYADRIADLPAVSEDCAGQITELQVWIAEAANDMAGVLVLDPQDSFIKIINIAVHPAHKGNGLGQALMGHAEAQALEQGCSEMRLATHVDMAENIGFYQRLGWIEQGRAGNRVLMSKSV